MKGAMKRMSDVITTYKGFNKDMTCRGFQYEEGKEYETEKAKACNEGFHACEYPLDVFKYYKPSESVYHIVEQSGEIDRDSDDSKVASTKIKIGASINIAGLVKAAIEYTTSRVKKISGNDERHGASSNTGYRGASSNTGYRGASSNTGDYGASSNTGYRGASSNTGDYGASSNTGNCGASSNTGYSGFCEAGHPNSVAAAWGPECKAKGVKGSYLVLAEWESNGGLYWKEETWTFKGAKMVRVDGETIKEDVWYKLKNGEVIEDREENEE